VFKPPEQGIAAGTVERPPVTLAEIARPPVSLTIPVSQIPAPEGEVDFQGVFRAAGIVSDNLFASAEKAMELRSNFSSLPQTTQVESVEAALKTFGIAEQAIVADAVAKGEAIDAYLEATQRETKGEFDRVNAEISELNAQIEERKKNLQDRTAFQDAVNRRCQEEMGKFAELIRFLASNDPKT
jgi:hypothetical protein